MRMRLRGAALVAIAGALMAGTTTPAVAQAPSTRTGPTVVLPAPTTWSPDLASGETAGVAVDAGNAVMDPDSAFLAPVEDGPSAEGAPVVPTGLLTLAPRQLDVATDRVSASVLGVLPAGSSATVDVRGRRTTGGWTEWIPARPTATGPAPTALLPEPATEVQSRLVLTGSPGTSPIVRDVTLTGHPAERTRLSEGAAEVAPPSYRVFATREGLAGSTTANGHVITERDHFVALPSRRALAPRGTGDYSVKVCAPTGRCAFAPVWDVGPWNTHDDYWNPSTEREEWSDLPQGVPQAQAAYADGYNGGRDQFGREVANPAGIDLGDGLFWDALGLEDNGYVTVDYLWTGNVRLAKVVGDAPVDVLSAPDAAATVVGIAAATAAVPVECVVTAETSGPGSWLRIGLDQYLAAAAVPEPGPVGSCAAEDAAAVPAVAPATVPAAVPAVDPVVDPVVDPAVVPAVDPVVSDPVTTGTPTSQVAWPAPTPVPAADRPASDHASTTGTPGG